ncbi:hypothetical protein FBZ89_103225 [Nitrospirillum amazonense]|uniref:Uncharacterized protein n=1 Tax=Nitrospirillum amazonense TaxID=28077 RepID=A0A560FLX3_9PROT|nr:hypothetical protein [Nitrospirillum amazonense]TWB22602.1 hypothetical protein FBZ89_103225 [Nitrospirillum amazonense]
MIDRATAYRRHIADALAHILAHTRDLPPITASVLTAMMVELHDRRNAPRPALSLVSGMADMAA